MSAEEIAVQQSIRNQWVQALLSGDYQQGMKRLRTEENKFCCLGVLCELAVKAGVIPEPKLVQDLDIYNVPSAVYTYQYAGYTTKVPHVVRDWAGLNNRSGFGRITRYRTSGTISTSLACLNDSGVAFAEIAAIIASNPEGLFKSNEPVNPDAVEGV